MNNKKITIIGFFDEKGSIMLNHRRDKGKPDQDVWELVGGSVKEGEEPIDAIKREVLEELDYLLKGEDALTFVKRIDLRRGELVFDIYYFSAKLPDLSNFGDTDEVLISDLRLVSVGEALDLPLLPITEHIILSIKNGVL